MTAPVNLMRACLVVAIAVPTVTLMVTGHPVVALLYGAGVPAFNVMLTVLAARPWR